MPGHDRGGDQPGWTFRHLSGGFWSTTGGVEGATQAGPVTWSPLSARIQTFPFDADDRLSSGPVLDPLLRDLGQANELMFGTDPLSAIQAAWETAALGGPAPAVPTSDWVAAQDVADRADLDAIHVLNAAGVQPAADAIPF